MLMGVQKARQNHLNSNISVRRDFHKSSSISCCCSCCNCHTAGLREIDRQRDGSRMSVKQKKKSNSNKKGLLKFSREKCPPSPSPHPFPRNGMSRTVTRTSAFCPPQQRNATQDTFAFRERDSCDAGRPAICQWQTVAKYFITGNWQGGGEGRGGWGNEQQSNKQQLLETFSHMKADKLNVKGSHHARGAAAVGSLTRSSLCPKPHTHTHALGKRTLATCVCARGCVF